MPRKIVNTSPTSPNTKVSSIQTTDINRKFKELEKFRNPYAKRKGANVYVHQTKTAGSSVALQPLVDSVGHRRFRDVPAAKRKDKDAFFFTCIRNPYDRAVSWYYYVRSQVRHAHACFHKDGRVNPNGGHYLFLMSTMALSVDLNEFWTRLIPEDWFYLHDGAFVFIRTQEQNLRANKKSVGVISPRFDFIMKFEQLNKDWDILRETRGFDPLEWTFKNKERPRHKHWSEQLSGKAIDKLTKLYRKDFEMLPYTPNKD